MRIYSSDKQVLINKVEISLTKEEAEDFQFRINDLANNPNYKDEFIRDDVVFGDLILKENGSYESDKSIDLFVYTEGCLGNISKLAYKIITKDKL